MFIKVQLRGRVKIKRKMMKLVLTTCFLITFSKYNTCPNIRYGNNVETILFKVGKIRKKENRKAFMLCLQSVLQLKFFGVLLLCSIIMKVKAYYS